ncbi:tyrosine-type recombinase/integrase, partial [Burkholderia pseudomallei]
MAGSRQLHRLTALRVSKALEPGYYSDGGGLQLQITTSGSRSWIFRYTLRGRSREMGLGALSSVSLAAARAKAARCRELLKDKIDPIEARDAEQRELAERLKQERQNARVFSDAAVDYIERQKPNWKNAKHAQQWLNTLTTYVFPTIGDVHVRDIDTPMMVKILQPIWSTKRETAARVRGRVESILDSEKALGYREGENPARWRGHLDQILPKGNRRKVKHHAALAWTDIPEFMRDLRA